MAKKSNVTFGIIAGMAIGALSALLTAPKSGKELRRDIKGAASIKYREVEKQLRQAIKQLSDKIAALKKGSVDQTSKDIEQLLQTAESIKQRLSALYSDYREGIIDRTQIEAVLQEYKTIQNKSEN